mmetsp:Transcript_121286/g.350237  ORF Transcript_121286/g.350237 Transcript_121286/m.350237 type:complete len:498 (-) Transcript_121286:109-1602(-)
MGRWKDAFFMEVWKHLLARNNRPEPLSQLNAPASGNYGIKHAWADLQTNAREERMKKADGVKVVLSERPDLFLLTPNACGHPCIQLTLAAQSFDPMEGIPATSLVASINQAAKDIEAALASPGDMSNLAAFGGDTGSSSMPASPGSPPPMPATGPGSALAALADAQLGGGEKHSWDELSMDGSTSASKKKKAKTTPQLPPGMNKRGLYMDLVWTPTLAAVKDREDRMEKEMARALLHAAEQYRGMETAVSKLGFDFKVARLKKENQFKNEKLLDIIKRHTEVFELVSDGQGGFNVNILPGALSVLYTSEELEMKQRAEAMLPQKIERPYNIRERMQALRIEVIHALHHRGGMANIQELGQEPGVQQAKQNIAQAKKLQDFVKLFPLNFVLQTVEGGSIIQLLSYSVEDRSMIDASVQQNMGAFGKGSKGCSKGFGKGAPPPRFGERSFSQYGSSSRGVPLSESRFGSSSSRGFSGGGSSDRFGGGFSSSPAPAPAPW